MDELSGLSRDAVVAELARRDFTDFALTAYSSLELAPFHSNYYRLLNLFARGKIRKLMITMPPQHGKSLASTILLPAYMLGVDPDKKIAIASYSASLATRFNRRIQTLMSSKQYTRIFPNTCLAGRGSGSRGYVRTGEQADIVGREGGITAVGREGALTGNSVDIFILDDLYKDAMEANSPVIRENCWEWYTSVVKTRLHNDSREIIVFTRWHEDDLIGRLMMREQVVELQSWDQLESVVDAHTWYHINMEAIKESTASEIDPRLQGEALWEHKHSIKLLNAKRKLDPRKFEALYQGKPSSREGLLYGDRFRTYACLPEDIVKYANYTDTADLGDDYLCSVCYAVGRDASIYVTDVVYSREGMEVTEDMVSDMLKSNNTREVYVESNNGGRGFARAISRKNPSVKVNWFHQSGNKEARILSNSATVLHSVAFPVDWGIRWCDLYMHLTTYRRLFRENRWHDAPDVLTGIVEKELLDTATKKIRAVGFSKEYVKS